jgi:RND superfamily putative drug exporter
VDVGLDDRIVAWADRARAHPGRAVLRWVGLAALAWVLAVAAGGRPVDQLSVPGSGSDRAASLAEGTPAGAVGGLDAMAVFHVRHGRVDTPARAAAIDTALTRLGQRPGMGDPDRPFVDGQVSADGTTAFAQVRSGYGAPLDEADQDHVLALRHQLAPLGIDVAVGGVLADALADPSPGLLEFVGVAIALVVLTRALGSWRAALWPVASAALAVAAALGAIELAGAYVSVPGYAAQLAALVGMGVGIDDGLLLMAAWSRAGDGGVRPATRRAGRSCLLAAATVGASLAGLAVTGIPFFAAMALATAIAVAAAAAAAVTLLPALVALDRRGVAPDAWVARPSPRRERRLESIVRRPGWAAVAGLGLILLLAAPALGMELAEVGAGSAPPASSRRLAHDLLVTEFGPGYADPFTVVLDHTDGLAWERGPTTERVRTLVGSVDGVERLLPVVWAGEGEQAAFRVVPGREVDQAHERALLASVRRAVDDGVAGTGTEAAVGGGPATRLDVAERVEQRLGWVVAVVAGLSVVLLVAAWRAPVLALKAAVLNGLSVAAAYGVLVAVFQWGWGRSLLGLAERVPIDPIVPVVLFAVLFGLSMDYEVFLVDAVREERAAGRTPAEAVVAGIAGRWRVVGAAALIMASVFAGFVADPDPVSKMFGVGLAAAVAIDATVARGVLVPATLALLGEWNWWRPGRRAAAPAATSAPRPGTAPSA